MCVEEETLGGLQAAQSMFNAFEPYFLRTVTVDYLENAM